MNNFTFHGFEMEFVFWLIVLLVFVFIFYQFNEKSNKKRSSAKEILDRHYTNGEIDTDEYRTRLNEIQSSEKSKNDL